MSLSLQHADDIRAISSRLISLQPQQRADVLRQLQEADDEDVNAEWVAVLHALHSADTPPTARSLLRKLESLTGTRESGKQLLAELMSHEQLQRQWIQWNIPDREELRLRLEVLARCGKLADELAPMITFFFRASVADLYQPAAIAFGRHLHRSASLRTYLDAYANKRDLPLHGPAMLDGQRPARRMLLLRAAACGRDGDLPLHMQRAGDAQQLHRPTNPADLSTLLLALDVLLMQRQEDAHFGQLVDQLLDGVAAASALVKTRSVLQRLGQLLIHRASEQAAEIWQQLFHEQVTMLRRIGENRFGQRVAGLIRVDECLRTLAQFDPTHAVSLAKSMLDDASPLERRLLSIRLWTWLHREHRLRDGWEEVLALNAGDSMSHTLRDTHAILDAAETSLRGGDQTIFSSAKPQRVDLFTLLLQEMQSQSRWLSHDTASRSLMAMLLLDQAQYVQLPPEQMYALLERFGLHVEANTPAEAADAAVPSILLRLLGWEQPGAEELIDTRMLHRIDSEPVLLALLPTQRVTALVSQLADALEHQLRWGLRRESYWSPEAFLMRISIRKPHGSFWTALQNVTRSRSYTNASGESVPVEALETWFAADAPHADKPPPDGDFIRAHSRLREALAHVINSNEPLPARLIAIAEVIDSGETGSTGLGRGSSIVSLFQRVYESHQPILQSGYPAWTDRSSREGLGQIESIAQQLRACAHAMTPATWMHGEVAVDAAHTVLRIVREHGKQLARLLPPVESALCIRADERLQQETVQWIDVLEHTISRWDEKPASDDASVQARASETIVELSRIAHPQLTPHLIALLWSSLRERSPGVMSDEDRWMREHDLLVWGLEHQPLGEADRTAWRQLLLETWNDLARRAMDRRDEQSLVRLLRDQRWKNLRRDEASAEVLRQCRSWCIDRLLLQPAHIAGTDLVQHGSARTASWLGTTGAFIGHYSNVWIALLLGCILMLDFGDAWKSMAEIGDVRGIGLTFLIGIVGTYIYLLKNLRDKSPVLPGRTTAGVWASRLRRACGFLCVCLVYAVGMTSFLWWLLSRTDEVVHGIEALGHIIVWSGFALFVGVFFGLIAGDA